MNIEKRFDKILDILYDENLLHWREIPSTYFIGERFRQNFNIQWTDPEINLILTILQNDGYVKLNEKDINNMEIPSFSLTTKGVQMKRNGGFIWNKTKSTIANIIVIWAAIFTVIISIYTIVNYVSDNRTKNNIDNNKPKQSLDNLTVPPIRVDTIRGK
jgi:hypothetical protein